MGLFKCVRLREEMRLVLLDAVHVRMWLVCVAHARQGTRTCCIASVLPDEVEDTECIESTVSLTPRAVGAAAVARAICVCS